MNRIKNPAALLVGLALLLLGLGSSHGQTLLAPSQPTSGLIERTDVFIKVDGLAEGGRYIDCFEIETEATSSWGVEVEASSLVWADVMRGDDCVTAEVLTGSKAMKAKQNLKFVSGGGRYQILVYAYLGTRYSIVAQPLMGSAGARLAPGSVVQPLDRDQKGTASTVTGSGRAFEPGQSLRDCPTCPEMVVLPAGSFSMGSLATEAGRFSTEGPRRLVTLARSFAMGKFEITFEEWDACVSGGGCVSRADDQGWGRGRQPVVGVSWVDAMAYAQWLSKSSGQRYFLPSEAEWEYAARAGTETAWNTGDAIITDDANMLNQLGRPVTVGAYPPNAFGLHDMHGNVSERVQDCYGPYPGAPQDGSTAYPQTCDVYVARGGSYLDEPAKLRSAARLAATQRAKLPRLGFRVARAL